MQCTKVESSNDWGIASCFKRYDFIQEDDNVTFTILISLNDPNLTAMILALMNSLARCRI